jgi:hypothetical protein
MTEVSRIGENLKTYFLEAPNHQAAWPTAPAVMSLELTMEMFVPWRENILQDASSSFWQKAIGNEWKGP